MKSITLLNGDCLEESDQIESGSVDLILTDLPYGTVEGIAGDGEVNHGMKGKTKRDVIINTDEIMKIGNRILRKNGKMILFAQQPFTTELINKAIPNLPYNYSLIREKDHFANSLIAKKAPVSYYEDILVFSKTHDQEGLHPLREYFKLVIDYIGLKKKNIINIIGQKVDHTLRINSTQYGLCTKQTYQELIYEFGIDKMEGFKEFEELEKINSIFNSVFNLRELKKYKSNILKYKKDYTGLHPTAKPVLLLEDLVKTYSNSGDLVVDLTMGSGSTGVACQNTGRDFIGIELDENYFNISKKRLGL